MEAKCLFINTREKPLNIRRLGLFRTSDVTYAITPLVFELCEVTYLHPDCKEATVKILEFLPVTLRYPSMIGVITQSIDAMRGIQDITDLNKTQNP